MPDKPQLSEKEKAIRRRLRDDFPHYAAKCLWIRSKSEATIPLNLNRPQQYLHQLIEQQRADTGKVRVIILKGRQQGCSTYIQARFYHEITWSKGKRAFILTHSDDATKNIFEIAERFQKNVPAPVKPSVGASNAKELYFDILDSGYRVGTAKTKDVGRSGTVQLFHGSEVAYWPKAETHIAGVMQSVPDMPGTEIVLESTSSGPAGYFYNLWRESVAGKTPYRAIFIPWWWSSEYTSDANGLEMTAEELAYQREYGLTDGQIAWRRNKIQELGGIWTFRREYPATPKEAFMAESPGALWTRAQLDRLRINTVPPLRTMAVAVDPATTSKESSDECGIIWGGIGLNGQVYIIGDESRRSRPIEWVRAAVAVYQEQQMERLVYESNQGGEMVEDLVATIDKTVAMKGVHASRNKRARAEPVSSLYEQGLVHHVGHLPALEDELCTWDAETSNESPNRLDALVWLVTYLKLRRRSRHIKLADSGEVGPSEWDI